MVEKVSTPQNKNEVTKRSFSKGSKVLMRNYSETSEKKWLNGTVDKQLGKVIYLIKLEDGRLYKRHLDRLRAV